MSLYLVVHGGIGLGDLSYSTNRTLKKPEKGKMLGTIIVINARLKGRLDWLNFKVKIDLSAISY